MPLHIQFRRVVSGDKWTSWLHLLEILMRVSLFGVPGNFKRKLTVSGLVTIKSLYADLLNGHKIKIFTLILVKVKV